MIGQFVDWLIGKFVDWEICEFVDWVIREFVDWVATSFVVRGLLSVVCSLSSRSPVVPWSRSPVVRSPWYRTKNRT